MEPYPSYIPDFQSQDIGRAFLQPLTIAHNYQQIVIPTHGRDIIFNQSMADLMEWTVMNQEEAANLSFLIQESYRQMGDCYDHTHMKFFHNLQGNPAESGVNGYPANVNLQHFDFTNKWGDFVTIFRHNALEFFSIVNPYAHVFPGNDFVYHKYIPGGWVFYLAPRRTYDI